MENTGAVMIGELSFYKSLLWATVLLDNGVERKPTRELYEKGNEMKIGMENLVYCFFLFSNLIMGLF